jgi:MFS transporter, ACS family, hexuronate transporter
MVVAPPLIALLLSVTSWRSIFVVTGVLGLVWTIWWRRDYFPPEEHPKLGDAERAHLQSVVQAGPAGEKAPGWLALLRFRQTWGLVTAKFLSDAAWYFYLFWLPKYLYDARGFDIKTVGTFAWIPPAAAGLGCLAGGCSPSARVPS